MESRSGRLRWLVPLALAAIVAGGVWLRMAVTWSDSEAAFLNDSAFHWRMIEEVVAHGHVPAPDRLSEPPDGRDVGAYLPVGMYHAAAVFHGVASALGSRDLRFNVLLFVALAGGLIALPVYGATRALSLPPWAALVAAAIAALMPAHLHRTYAYWLRYDALGTLLVLGHVAFALRALGGRRPWIDGAISAAFLFLALACWRVALLVPMLELVFMLIWVTARGASPALRIWFSLKALAVLIAGLGFAHQRANAFVTSPMAVVFFCVAIAVWLPFLRSPGARPASLVAAVFLGLALARVFARGDAVAEQLSLGSARALSWLGLHAVTSPMVTLQLSVEELRGASLLNLLSPGFLSWSGAWFLVAPVLAWLAAGRPSLRSLGDGPALFILLCLGMTLATLLFERDKVLLGPMAAIALGALLGLWASARMKLRYAIVPTLLISLAVTAYDAVMVAFSRRPRLEPDYVATLAFLRERTPSGTVVLAPWELGYEIQSYARRAAVMDGLLESRANGPRITSFARASFAPAPDSLVSMAREYGASYLVVPSSEHLYGLGLVAGVPFADKLVRGTPLEPEESQGAMTQMMVLGRSYPGLEKVFEQGSYRIYRLPPATRENP